MSPGILVRAGPLLMVQATTQFAERDHNVLPVRGVFLQTSVPCLDVRHRWPLYFQFKIAV